MIVIFGLNISLAQSVRIKVNTPISNKVILTSLQGEKISFIDTSFISGEGKFEFNFDDIKYHRGFYRLSFNSNKWIDFVYDNENVEIETDATNILDSLKVIISESNGIYYEFVKLNKDYKTKAELLQLIIARYPKDDDYYQITKEKLIQIQEEYLNFVNTTSKINPNSFIARYVRSAQLPVIKTNIPFDKQITYLKTHALDNVDFFDDGLIYSDVFTNKTIEYLTYYRNPQLPKELLEKEFMNAVDTILTKARVNSIVYQHIVEYLIDGFKKFGFDNAIDYIVNNYVIKDDLCLDEELSNTIERRIQQARNFNIGNIVPNIILPDSSGFLVELNKLSTDKTLIIFYASWCPHCQNILPQINELYKKQNEKEFEVYAVSIDTSRSDWLGFLRTNKMNWINVSDLIGWDGKATTDYFIYATPTMFLVDSKQKLLGVPKNIGEVHKMIL
ncbi:MAG: TlpA disulfide reductase family protein [Ignavibacteria bacterium]